MRRLETSENMGTVGNSAYIGLYVGVYHGNAPCHNTFKSSRFQFTLCEV